MAAVCIGILVLCLLPWGIRNELQLGSFIITRSNFGLELAIGNAPGALGYSGSGSASLMHPHDWAPSAEAVRRKGEVAYMRQMTRQAENWIAADPMRFLRLTLIRARLMFLPEPEMVGWVPGLGARVTWLLVVMLGTLKLAAIVGAVCFGIRRWISLFYVVLPALPYFVTHVNMRYEFLIHFTSLAVLALVFDRILGWLSRKRRVSPEAEPDASTAA